MAILMICKDDGTVSEVINVGISEIYDPQDVDGDDFFLQVIEAIETADAQV